MTDWRDLSAGEWTRRLEALAPEAGVAAALGVYLELLGRWSRVTNLVGRVDEAGLLREHVAESLAGAEFLPSQGRIVDMGSGGGFPAIPLLVARPGLSGVLLEPRERRWSFLREVGRELGLEAEVVRETVTGHRGSGYETATVRGLAVGEWGSRVAGLLGRRGQVLWWRSRGGEGAEMLVGLEPVLTSPLPDVARGEIAIWRRCST